MRGMGWLDARVGERNLSLKSIVLWAAMYAASSTLCDGYRLKVLDLSDRLVPYKTAWRWQEQLVQHHINLQQSSSAQSDPSSLAGTLLMLQHPSVYTLGSGTTADSGPFRNIASDGRALEYEVFKSDRAGQATYHGPGQLVCYPIFDLHYFGKDIHKFLRRIEEVVIQSLAHYGITAGRSEGLTGVWVGDRKLAAIGLRISRWVTMHGVALNVNPDLAYFSNIVPCGIKDKEVGSIAQFVPSIHLSEVKSVVRDEFAKLFECELENVDASAADALLHQIMEGIP